MPRSSWVEPERAGRPPPSDRRVAEHVAASQPAAALSAAFVPGRVADLQRLAGNRAVASLQRQGATATAHRTVRAGSTGADVEELQTKLNTALPGTEPLAVDGIFGPKTPPPPGLATLQLGSTGPDVAEAQQKLNAAGLGIAVLAIDGVYDRTTALVVLTFELTHGIPPTGILDPASRVALDAAVPGGGHDAAGIENAVDNPGGAHPLGTQVPGTVAASGRGTGAGRRDRPRRSRGAAEAEHLEPDPADTRRAAGRGQHLEGRRHRAADRVPEHPQPERRAVERGQLDRAGRGSA